MMAGSIRLGFMALCVSAMLCGCLGSDKPRAVVHGQTLDKPYIPPPDVELLTPGYLKRSDLEFRQRRKAAELSTQSQDVNPWKATDEDIERIRTYTTVKPKAAAGSDSE